MTGLHAGIGTRPRGKRRDAQDLKMLRAGLLLALGFFLTGTASAEIKVIETESTCALGACHIIGSRIL